MEYDAALIDPADFAYMQAQAHHRSWNVHARGSAPRGIIDRVWFEPVHTAPTAVAKLNFATSVQDRLADTDIRVRRYFNFLHPMIGAAKKQRGGARCDSYGVGATAIVRDGGLELLRDIVRTVAHFSASLSSSTDIRRALSLELPSDIDSCSFSQIGNPISFIFAPIASARSPSR